MERLTLLRATELWVIPAITLASLLTSKALLLLLALFLVYRLLQWLHSGTVSDRTPIDIPVVLLLLIPIPLTFWATVQPEITHLQVYRLLGGIALLYTLVNGIKTERTLHYVVGGMIASGIGLACLAPFTVEWITDKFFFIPRFIYTLAPLLTTEQIHPNVIAGPLALLLPIPVALLLFGHQQLTQVEKRFYGFALLLIGLILLLTQSRGALTGFVLAMLLFLLLRWRWGWLIGLTLSAALLLMAYLGRLDLFLDRTELSTVRGWEGRQEIWSRALAIIQDFPLTGIGMGNFDLIASTFYPFFLAAPGQTPHAHQLLLQIAVDLGLPGLIFWLSILLIVLLLCWQILTTGRRTNANWLMGLGAGLFGSQVVLLTHGLTDAVLWGTKTAVFLWALWGIVLAAVNLYIRSTDPTSLVVNSGLQ